jgi:hypothetical protein
LPYLLSILNRLKSRVSVARRSPCVKAPKHSNRFATLYRKKNIYKLRIKINSYVDAKRFSPANSDITKTYSGAET